MRITTILSSLLLTATAVGCSGVKRDAETYRADTRSLLETKNSQVKACYDQALVDDQNVSGEVLVRFKVEKKTGRLYDVAVDPAGTQAPESLQSCIVRAVDGLVLDPVDRREGIASYKYTFKANPPVQL
jgi:ABC-type sugar transport system substrate-binding protein